MKNYSEKVDINTGIKEGTDVIPDADFEARVTEEYLMAFEEKGGANKYSIAELTSGLADGLTAIINQHIIGGNKVAEQRQIVLTYDVLRGFEISVCRQSLSCQGLFYAGDEKGAKRIFHHCREFSLPYDQTMNKIRENSFLADGILKNSKKANYF